MTSANKFFLPFLFLLSYLPIYSLDTTDVTEVIYKCVYAKEFQPYISESYFRGEKHLIIVYLGEIDEGLVLQKKDEKILILNDPAVALLFADSWIEFSDIKIKKKALVEFNSWGIDKDKLEFIIRAKGTIKLKKRRDKWFVKKLTVS